jgi:uncharacterized protein YdeI (YjbR/CyaY-like superfamily)
MKPTSPAASSRQGRVIFFKSSDEFRTWLGAHGETTVELWVGFFKKASGRTGLTYQEAVDEALCAGWIDGLKKRHDEASYVHRFTPRAPKSTWSGVNLRRMRALKKAGRVTAAGHRVFQNRDRNAPGYTYESRPDTFDAASRARFRKHGQAWAFFAAQPPGYRRLAIGWVANAKREETRARRLAALIACSARGRRWDPMASAAARS